MCDAKDLGSVCKCVIHDGLPGLEERSARCMIASQLHSERLHWSSYAINLLFLVLDIDAATCCSQGFANIFTNRICVHVSDPRA